ncbi:MAG TPA: protein kinase [Thermoanaerobaculia bacterium]|jgi:Tol biopolymer transport system component|nr:protein kinase [Thermoanaerobaculia bacterium]
MSEETLPKRIGRYRVISLIGRGGMGEVYLALDPSLRRQVAIKILPHSLATDASMKARFVHEARAVASLNHPNIVTIHEVGETGDDEPRLPKAVPFLVMEFVEGRPLGDVIEEGSLLPEEAMRISAQILEGLAAAHQVGLIHRDVKPGNIMITADGRVKILDFGLSKLIAEGAESAAVSRLTAEGMITGTVEYLSPEQALGKPLDKRTDLFSFGIVLYEMLTRRYPFAGTTVTEKLANIVTQPPRAWPETVDVPEPVKAIVARSLEKEPEKRYASASEVLRDVDAVRRELWSVTTTLTTATVRPASGTSGTPRPDAPVSGTPTQILATVPPRKTARYALAAGLAVVAIGAIVATLVLYRRDDSPIRIPREGLRPVQITDSAGLDLFPSFSPDGGAVAYASDRSGAFEIYVRHLASGGGEIQITSDGAQNVEPSWSPDGRTIAFTSIAQRGVFVVPALGGAPKRLTDFGSSPSWSPDGSEIVFQSDPVVDLSGGAFPANPPSAIHAVSSGGGPVRRLTSSGTPKGGHGSPVFTRDGKRVLFVTYVRPNSEMWTVSRDGKDVHLVSSTQSYYVDPVPTADGRFLLFGSTAPTASSGAGFGLWGVPFDARSGKTTGPARELLNLGSTGIRRVAVSADGTKVAFAALRSSSNLVSLSLKEKDAAPSLLTNGVGRNSRPAFSPDGSLLAFTSWRTGKNKNIWLMSSDGTKARQLSSDQGQEDFASWFPDGDRIAFASTRGSHVMVYLLSLKSVGESLLADPGPDTDSPHLSPDGKWIAYNSRHQGQTLNTWVAKSDGSGGRQITFDKELMGFPCWSPDSTLLAVETRRGGDTQVAVVPREGGTPEVLTSSSGAAWPYSFTPDGGKIACAALRNGFWNVIFIDRKTKEETAVTHLKKLNAYVRYPAVSPGGDRVVYEYSETTGNVFLLPTGRDAKK